MQAAACGRQGDLLPPPGAASDPRIDRYFDDPLDGPIKAPGDTEEDEGITGVEEQRHRTGTGAHDASRDERRSREGGETSGGGGGAA